LRLRKLTAGDTGFIVELLNDPNWLKYIGDRGVKNLQDALVYIQQGPQTMYQQHGVGLLLVESLAHQQPLGLCGLLKRTELPHPDLGFAFLPLYRRQGFALEACKLVLADAFEKKITRNILAITSVNNDASINLLKKLNFNFTKLIHLSDDAGAVNLFELIPRDSSQRTTYQLIKGNNLLPYIKPV
jgi:RimJ/RimL family protein N-acetyltransferase